MSRKLYATADNDVLYFDVAAINKGTTLGHGVRVVFTVPEGLEYVSSGGNDGVYNPVTEKWLLGPMTGNTIKSINLGYKVTDIDLLPLTISWTIETTNNDIELDDNDAAVTYALAPTSSAQNFVHQLIRGSVFREGGVFCGSCPMVLAITSQNNCTINIDQDGTYYGQPTNTALGWDFTWTATCQCTPDIVYGGYVVTGYGI